MSYHSRSSHAPPTAKVLEAKQQRSVVVQALEIEGVTADRKPAHAEALLRQLACLGNLEEVRLATNFEVVASCFRERDLRRLQKLLPASRVSFVGHRMCGPNCLPLC